MQKIHRPLKLTMSQNKRNTTEFTYRRMHLVHRGKALKNKDKNSFSCSLEDKLFIIAGA